MDVNRTSHRGVLTFGFWLLTFIAVLTASAEDFRAGVAGVVITPTEPMWAGGYASHTRPNSETLQDLYAKALALEDTKGTRVVIVTLDLLGIPRSISDPLCKRLEEKYGLRREQILLNTSHTHSGPALPDQLVDVYPMTDQDWEPVRRYSAWVQERIVALVGDALANLQPAQLSEAIGRCDLAVNRRENKEPDVVPGYKPKGPIDHDLPVLRVTDRDGKLHAVLFRYSCHCTVMDFYKWCGDYAGYAMAELEKKHPGAIALFAQGCGADANPLPRRKIELCEKYGRQLAADVDKVLAGSMRPLKGELRAAYKTISLPITDLPDRATLEAQATATESLRWPKYLAKRMLALLDAGQALPDHYPAYPVQAIQIGHLTLVALGGEVVVDYALRLQKELGGERTWPFGYSNDVMAYIPSRRVLAEGGYEGHLSMAVYGLPGKWAPVIEERIIAAVQDVVKQVRTGNRWALGESVEVQHNTLTTAERNSGFRLLFNGKDLTGWEGEPGYWSAENGELVGRTVNLPENTFLATREEFGDFLLRFSVKIRNHNSGVQFRGKRLPNHIIHGYQAEIGDKLYGILHEEGGPRNNLVEGWKDKGEHSAILDGWNEMTVEAVGPHITITINGLITADYVETQPELQPPKGPIALQLRGGPPMEVRFRDIRVKSYDQ